MYTLNLHIPATQRSGRPWATPPATAVLTTSARKMRAYRFSPSPASVCFSVPYRRRRCRRRRHRERATARGNSLRSGRRFQTPRPVELRPCVKYCHHLCCTVLPTTEDDASMYLLYEEKKEEKLEKCLLCIALETRPRYCFKAP